MIIILTLRFTKLENKTSKNTDNQSKFASNFVR